MAEQNVNLPDLSKTPIQPLNTENQSQSAATSAGTGSPIIPNTEADFSGKEIAIGFSAILVAAVIFFFVKNYVSKMLVASYKKSPRSADMAGWSLFCILLFAAAAATLGILNSEKFLSLPYLIPICLAMLLSLIMFFMALSSKR